MLRVSRDHTVAPGERCADMQPVAEVKLGETYVMPTEPSPNPCDKGGNMDYRDVRAGSTLLLRARCEGGMLALGDAHAAQGWGEVLGLGVECAGEVTLTVTRDSRYQPQRPMLLKDGAFACIACRPTFHEARDLAGCAQAQAHLYVSTVGSLMNGAVWYVGRQQNLPVVVALEVPLPSALAGKA